MSVLRQVTISATALLAMTVLTGVCLSASAQVLNSPSGNALIRQNDLQILQNRIQRQQYQQQQQQYRAQDRQIVPQPRPEVPTLKPSCQTQIIGTTAVTNCR